MCYQNCIHENYHGDCRIPRGRQCPYDDLGKELNRKEFTDDTGLSVELEWSDDDKFVTLFVDGQRFADVEKNNLSEQFLNNLEMWEDHQ